MFCNWYLYYEIDHLGDIVAFMEMYGWVAYNLWAVDQNAYRLRLAVFKHCSSFGCSVQCIYSKKSRIYTRKRLQSWGNAWGIAITAVSARDTRRPTCKSDLMQRRKLSFIWYQSKREYAEWARWRAEKIRIIDKRDSGSQSINEFTGEDWTVLLWTPCFQQWKVSAVDSGKAGLAEAKNSASG